MIIIGSLIILFTAYTILTIKPRKEKEQMRPIPVRVKRR